MQRFSVSTFVLAFTGISLAISTVAHAQSPDTGGLSVDSDAYDYRAMYIDSSNNVRTQGSPQLIPVVEAAANLMQEGPSANEIRQAVQVMRKRMNTINAELRGSELGAARIRTQQITLRRTIRVNERYLRSPTDYESERVESPERILQPSVQAMSQQERSRFVRISPQEERGPASTSFAGVSVRPGRYSSPVYDAELVKQSLVKVESRLEKHDETIGELRAMKSQVAKCILLLEGELRNRTDGGSSLSAHALTSSSLQHVKSPGQKPCDCTACKR